MGGSTSSHMKPGEDGRFENLKCVDLKFDFHRIFKK